MNADEIAILEALERKVLWLSTWMIHNANHLRESEDGLKVGGHQASSASMVSILTALWFATLTAEDRVAVKPHASPAFHAIQHLLGNIGLNELKAFRGLGGAQSYPSRTKDVDPVDFSTGSVGLGVAQTLFASMTQSYLEKKEMLPQSSVGRMIALAGDAELDEGNIYEALLEGWKHDVRNLWWVIDYNRQSLDAVVREGLWERIESIFESFGWNVVVLKFGRLQQAAFVEPGGAALRDWIDRCPNQLYAALTYQGGAAFRARLLTDLGSDPEARALIESRSDSDLAKLMSNLGGHDLAGLVAAFEAAHATDRPTCFIAYTIKGYGLPLAGHKDNHAGLLTPSQIAALRDKLGIRAGHEWDRHEGIDVPIERFDFRIAERARSLWRRGEVARHVAVPNITSPARSATPVSTQQAFGQILHEIARGESELADRIVTLSPDVTVSTNLGPWVNRRGLFARETVPDTFRSERIPSAYSWESSPKGQHFELGIAEMNLFTLMSALGLSHDLFGTRLFPIGTIYDPFICRGLDALNYACYQDARFLLVATPSGLTLAPEGGAHQSIATPLIGMAQDGLLAFEPAFVDELAHMLAFSFEYMQRSETPTNRESAWLRDRAGGSVYLRLSTRPIEQPARVLDTRLRDEIIQGGYWLREPGPNPDIVVVAMGAIVPEAIEAVGLMAEDRRDVGLMVVTSADRLNAGWTAAQRARQNGEAQAMSHIETLLRKIPRHTGIISILDGHPATLAWIGSVQGHRVRALGVEHFGQSGSLHDLYRKYGLDAQAIIQSAEALAPGRPMRHLRAV